MSAIMMTHKTRAAGIDLHTTFFFDVRVDNIDRRAAMAAIQRYVSEEAGAPARKVFFTNVHSIHLSRKNKTLRATINRADLVLPDGAGLNIAGRMVRKPIRENLNGTDFMPEVLGHAETAGWTVYLFGARSDVLGVCRARIELRYPRLRIVGAHHGYVSGPEEQAVIEDIRRTAPDLLLVALGSPRQETWIAQHADTLNARVCFAVGGLFDFLSGDKKRAPLWMRRLGIEWLFRLMLDPKAKWDRTLIEIPVFLSRVFVARLMPPRTP